MCVIICCEKDYPDKKTLKEAEQWNENGGGMAWIEKGKVRYRKGIKGKEMLDIIEKRKVQLPFIVHFRIATVGKVCNELCHPFPIEDEAPLKTHGITDAVLFHNGQWSDWRDWLLKTAIRKKIKMPRDIWSDSRGLAFLAYHYGIDVLNTISTNKIAVLTKDGIQKFGDRWCTIGKVSCSNDTFDRTNVTMGGEDSLYGVDDDWSETYGGYSICGFEGYYKDGQWHPKDESVDRKNLAKSIDDTVEEEIEKHLADASKEELANDVKTTDQITRNAIRYLIRLVSTPFVSACLHTIPLKKGFQNI